jgi:putative addiction module component (TIGR02574 family)
MKTPSLQQLEEQARELSAEERAKLAQTLLDTLHTPVAEVEAAWADEIARRVAAFDRGEIPAYPAEDVFAEARRILR